MSHLELCSKHNVTNIANCNWNYYMHINANNMLKNTAQNIIYTDKIYVRNHLYVLRLLGPHITWVDTSSTVCWTLQDLASY